MLMRIHSYRVVHLSEVILDHLGYRRDAFHSHRTNGQTFFLFSRDACKVMISIISACLTHGSQGKSMMLWLSCKQIPLLLQTGKCEESFDFFKW